jgi:nucleoside phosphorylase
MVKLEGKKGRARVALLTVTVEEFEVVRTVFGLNTNVEGTPYFVSGARQSPFEVVGRRAPGQTNVISEKAAGDLIEDFRPEFLILIGTAGSCQARAVRLGDVVVADYVDYSGYWKLVDGRVLLRRNPHDHPSLFLHEGFVERLRVEEEVWRRHIAVARPVAGQADLHVGNLVSGDLLLGDITNPAQRYIIDYFDKAIAFEMEGFGVARAVFQSRRFVYYNPQFLIVRGISDYVDVDPAGNVGTRGLWTNYAVSAATAVAYALVQKMSERRRQTEAGLLRTVRQKVADWVTPDA